MKKGNTLVNILYWLCNISFYLLVLLILYVLAFGAFTDDGKWGNLRAGIHHSNGYQVLVKFQISPERPMLNNFIYSKKNEGININGQKYSNGTLEYVKPLTAVDSLNFKTKISLHNNGMVDYYDITKSVFSGDGYITVKPKTLVNKIIIVFRTYLNLVVLILVFFFLKKIFKALKTNFEFSHRLSKLIKTTGALLIFKVLLESVSGFILGIVLPYISIEPFDYNMKYVNISINPRLEFDFTLFLIGLALIILSTLLKEGNRIQQENDLTI